MNSSKRTSSDCAAGQDVAVAHARPQHLLDARAPVPAHDARVGVVGAEARAVGDHRAERHGDGHRIAVRDDVRRVREHGRERAELLEVLGRLEDPAFAAAQELEHLEDLAQVPVRRRLVVRLVVVAPRRHRRDRLEQHRREVDREELDLLVDVPRRHLVHALEVRQRVVEEAERRCRCGRWRGSGSPGAGCSDCGEHRFEALPVGQRPQRGVGRHRGCAGGSCPVRGSPQITIGRATSSSRISGWRRTRSSTSRRFFSSASEEAARVDAAPRATVRPRCRSWRRATARRSRKSSGPKSSRPVSAEAWSRRASGERSIASANTATPSSISETWGGSCGSSKSSMRTGAGRSGGTAGVPRLESRTTECLAHEQAADLGDVVDPVDGAGDRAEVDPVAAVDPVARREPERRADGVTAASSRRCA